MKLAEAREKFPCMEVTYELCGLDADAWREKFVPHDGELHWRNSNRGVRQGKSAGTRAKYEHYIAHRVDGKLKLIPRRHVNWLMEWRWLPVNRNRYIVYRMDGDQFNDCVSNLKLLTAREAKEWTRARNRGETLDNQHDVAEINESR